MNEQSVYPELNQFLTQEQKQMMLDSTVREFYRKGDGIHRHGDTCVGIIGVRSGSLAFSLLSEDGKEITVFRIGNGQMLVLSAACVLQRMEMPAVIMAETDAEVDILPAPVLSKLMEENPLAASFIYRTAMDAYGQLTLRLQELLFFSLEKRLTRYLLSESVRLKSDTIRATHEQIARYIGSSREVVSRTLRQMSIDGYVTTQRGGVTITNRNAVRKLAEM